MNITEDLNTFREACLDTPFGAFCVKKAGKTMQELFDDKHGHGVIVSPQVVRGEIDTDVGLHLLVAATAVNNKVKVRGHGWDFETPFVWEGTVAEFRKTWIGD